jgi:hypothetical protein
VEIAEGAQSFAKRDVGTPNMPRSIHLAINGYFIQQAEGHRKKPDSCPVARAMRAALKRTCGRGIRVSVSPGAIRPDTEVTVVIPGPKATRHVYQISGISSRLRQWDSGSPMQPFDCEAVLVL